MKYIYYKHYKHYKHYKKKMEELFLRSNSMLFKEMKCDLNTCACVLCYIEIDGDEYLFNCCGNIDGIDKKHKNESTFIVQAEN